MSEESECLRCLEQSNPGRVSRLTPAPFGSDKTQDGPNVQAAEPAVPTGNKDVPQVPASDNDVPTLPEVQPDAEKEAGHVGTGAEEDPVVIDASPLQRIPRHLHATCLTAFGLIQDDEGFEILDDDDDDDDDDEEEDEEEDEEAAKKARQATLKAFYEVRLASSWPILSRS